MFYVYSIVKYSYSAEAFGNSSKYIYQIYDGHKRGKIGEIIKSFQQVLGFYSNQVPTSISNLYTSKERRRTNLIDC